MLLKHHYLCSLTMLLAFSGCTTPNEYQPPPPPEVTVAHPIVQDVTFFLEENGQTESVDRAEALKKVNLYNNLL